MHVSCAFFFLLFPERDLKNEDLGEKKSLLQDICLSTHQDIYLTSKLTFWL